MQKKNHKLSKYTILFILLLIPYVLLFFISTQNIFPGNPVKEKTSKIGKHLYEFFPQGWAFYSKNPRESTYRVVYTKTGKSATQFPNASPSNYFGFTREGRAQGIEAGRLVAGLHESKWMKTEDNPIEFGRHLKPIKIKNDLQKPTLKGDILVYYEQPVPWNWAKNFKKGEYMPSKVVRIDVS